MNNRPPPGPPEAPESLFLDNEPLPLSPSPMALELLWQDHVFQGLVVAGLIANIALLVFLAVRFGGLPDPLPLHFDSSGLPDRIESKNGIFALPIIGAVVFTANTILGIALHHRERAMTILLVIGTLFVQALMWLAAVNLAGPA